MSISLKFSLLWTQRCPNWERDVREKNPQKFFPLPPPQTAAPVSSEPSFIRHLLRCNSVSQTKPPTADTPLTSAVLPTTPPRFHSFLCEGRAEQSKGLTDTFSQKKDTFPRRSNVDSETSWEVKLLWNQAQTSPPAVWRSHFSPDWLTQPMNRFYRKSHNAAQLCFPLSPFPHT